MALQQQQHADVVEKQHGLTASNKAVVAVAGTGVLIIRGRGTEEAEGCDCVGLCSTVTTPLPFTQLPKELDPD